MERSCKIISEYCKCDSKLSTYSFFQITKRKRIPFENKRNNDDDDDDDDNNNNNNKKNSCYLEPS